MASFNLPDVEYGLSKLRVADLALMALCEARNDRDLDDIHHTVQAAYEQIKGTIQDEEEGNVE